MARILVVDDSPTDLAALRKMLESDGHEVSECTEGAEAVERVKADKPDCVLMDVVMPGMNGFQATSGFRPKPREPRGQEWGRQGIASIGRSGVVVQFAGQKGRESK